MSIKKSSTILLVSRFVKTLIDIISVMILSRYLEIADYGIYRQIVISQQLVVSVLTLGIPNAALYYLSSKKEKEYLINLYTMLFSISFLVLLISPILTNLFYLNFKVIFFRKNELIIGLIYSLSIFSSVAENVLVALNKIKNVAVYALIPTTFWLVGLLVLYTSKYTVQNILTLMILRYLVGIILLVMFTYKEINFRFLNIKKIRDILVFGIPIGLSSMLGILNKNVDKLIVGYFVNNTDFAVFSNGAYEIPFLSLITSSLYTVLIPQMAKLNEIKDTKNIKKLWLRAGNIMITIMIPLASTFIFFSKPFILFMFSNKYLDSVEYFRIYQIMLYFRIYVYGSVFVATKNSKLYLTNALYSLVFNFVLDILLVIKFGPLGAVAATVMTTVFSIFLQLKYIKDILKIKFVEVFPWKNWILAIALTILINSVLYTIYHLISNNVYMGLLFMMMSFILSFYVLSKKVNGEILDYSVSILKKMFKNKE
ncbi:hypothetical protein SU69_01885 [Thermosipho melanesiensis]|uniref:Polysaccharide biosynthesis protein n=2 Tax=Thermosipho melanesiensis TaxID=46541 RepID=A6LJX9_THEM4|nr:oligosaccharide flippase family protein [Thermosipho melanesiensis]ABR30230.1 polysaccharide biosynthesis protein [Thermosipho melanesiensis BI429]APT74806.1 hypothetical protein BW47_01965 [Thermosipho melanesiensis]OOC37363.1 hypothetical protein SU68_01895 [Thermosipho melanesiensis]OOC39725.1 hypothetical protein SU69_01885 [Thermosipho melanesiensis]OOC39830.1 hypothetical protein SU70_01880 [Thermosipho melanesiensis]